MYEKEEMFKRKAVPEKVILRRYEKDVVIKFQERKAEDQKKRNFERGSINHFSYQSQRRLKLFARNTAKRWKVFITLTYPRDYPFDGKEVKRHIDSFMKRMKRNNPDMAFFWTMEFQRRGAPHFHILTDKKVDKEWLSRSWYEVVGSGDLRHLRAGTNVGKIKDEQQAIAYVISYLKGNKEKWYQKVVPDEYENVGRFWSHSRGILEKAEYEITDTSDNNRRNIRTFRRWYKAKLRSWGFPGWRWKGKGFTAWEGASFFNELKKRGLPNDLTEYF